MNKVFKVGLIGCGHIAETYFRGHQYFNNFKIVACADINQKAAEKCAKLYNIKSMTVNEILKDKDIGRAPTDNKRRHKAPFWERAELKQRLSINLELH